MRQQSRSFLCRFVENHWRRSVSRVSRTKRRRLGAESLESRRLLATFAVNGVDFTTIQDAIDAAAATQGDDIVEVSPGTYNELLTINDSSGGLTVRGSSGQRADVVVDGGQQDDVVTATLTNNVTIEDMVITNGGNQADSLDAYAGRGILARGPANLSVRNVSVSDNRTGGLVVTNATGAGGNVTVAVGDFSGNNNALFFRGVSDVDISDVNASGNRLHGIYAENSGAVRVASSSVQSNSDNGIDFRRVGDVTLDDITVSQNGSGSISGIYWADTGAVSIADSIFNNNAGPGIVGFNATGLTRVVGVTATDNGGRGMFVRNTGTRADVRVEGGVFANNVQGGVSVDNAGGVTVIGSELRDNGPTHLREGGGIKVTSTTAIPVLIREARVLNNVIGNAGGGIFIDVPADDVPTLQSPNKVVIEDTLIRGNMSGFSQSATGGGGIHLADPGGFALISGTVIDNNSAGNGDGGGIEAAGMVTIVESTITDNSGGHGGGIHADGSDDSITVERSTISGNSARGFGGGINSFLATVDITNSTISGNTAREGGGLFTRSGTIAVQSSTITLNDAPTGGGLSHLGTVSVGNSIIAGNTINQSTGEVRGFVNSLGFNFVGAVTPNAGFNAPGDQAGPIASPLDAKIGPLSDNGGPTETHALLDDSPAIDAGGGANTPATDQRSVSRPQGSAVDIGSFERENQGPTLTVNHDSVTVDEGQVAQNSGLFLDPDLNDNVVVTASIGAITQDTGHRGTWNWSFDTSDGPTDNQTVTITADDGQQTFSLTFELIVRNVAPAVTELTSSSPDLESKSLDGAVTIRGAFSDPAGSHDTHSVRVNWGDASDVETLPLSAVNQADDEFAADHTYVGGGIYTITVTIVDDDSGTSQPATTTAVVSGVGLHGRVLQIIGTDGIDDIRVQRRGDQIRIRTVLDGSRSPGVEFDQQAVDSIEVFACDGDDHVRIARRIALPATVFGGDGDDDLRTGSGNDSVDGGLGADEIRTRGGNDVITDSNGDNRIWAGDGDDQVTTGDGADWIRGGSGDDIILAGAGNDNIAGGGGNDAVSGGLGNDTIRGNDGLDLLIGGSGEDNIRGGRGDDLLIAGSTANENDLASLQSALADWTANDLAAALTGLGAITDDGDEDILRGNRGDDELIGGVGDSLRP